MAGHFWLSGGWLPSAAAELQTVQCQDPAHHLGEPSAKYEPDQNNKDDKSKEQYTRTGQSIDVKADHVQIGAVVVYVVFFAVYFV